MRVFSAFAWGVHRKFRAERQRLFLSVQSVVLPKRAHPGNLAALVAVKGTREDRTVRQAIHVPCLKLT